MQMTREDLDEWLAALRSGEFPQGQLALSDRGKFCCLGVKAELDSRKGRVKKTHSETHEVILSRYSYDGSASLWPHSMQSFYNASASGLTVSFSDLEKALPDCKTLYRQIYTDVVRFGDMPLTYFNDNGMSFSDIANVLEQCVEVI